MNNNNLNWYALFVRSRHEFVTREQLRKQGIEAFLPTVTRARQWSDRTKSVTVPLFPGYVFVHVRASAESFLQAVTVRGSVSFVSHEPGRPTPIDPGEMEALLLMTRSGRQIDIYPHLCEGAQVCVKRGPLTGAEGILVRKDEQHLFLVNINILGRCLGMKIDAEDLEAA
jgi:transcription antitermination factor NusG